MARSYDEREKMMNHFADPDGSDTMEFRIERPEKDNKTFSEDALNTFKDDVFLFIGGRICAFHTKQDQPARKLKVRIEVIVEG